MQKQQPIQDTNRDLVYVATKPYSEKSITGRTRRAQLAVSIGTFTADLYVFDEDIRNRYTNDQVSLVLKIIFKKAAEHIIKKLWRMPFPSGHGSVYMQARQNKRKYRPEGSPPRDVKLAVSAMMNDLSYELKRVFLKWNKHGKAIPYKNIWCIKACKGVFRSIKYQEISDRYNDAGKEDYRAHII